jgi:hypothetical protein
MIDQALLDAGIQDADVETRLEGQGGKSLLITKRELLYFENGQLQRGRLREIVNVKTAKSGELTVKSPNESLIEGSIKGFDLAELKFFFESVKNAIAQAKASATGADIPVPKVVAPAPISPTTAWDNPSPPASGWDHPSAAPANGWNTPPTSSAWMPEKQTFEVAPDMIPQKPGKDSWADLEADLNPAQSGSVPPLLNASAMIPPPSPSLPSKPAVDPFADLAKNSPNRPSSDDWDSPSATINLKPDTGATAVMVPSSGTGEWDGEIMDATKALDSKTPQKGKGNLRIGDNAAAIEGLARMLRIMSLGFFIASAGVQAALLLNSNFAPDTVTVMLMVVGFIGSVFFALLGYAISELIFNWAKASADLRSIRKATLGH